MAGEQCLCVPAFSDEGARDPAAVMVWEAAAFGAQVGEVLVLAGEPVPIALVGLGPRGELSPTDLRISAAAAGRRLSHLDRVRVDFGAVDLPGADADTAWRAVAEGLLLGAYRFDTHRAGPRARTNWVPADESEGWALGVQVATAVNAVRDLVNEPANVLTPSVFAERCRALAEAANVDVVVRDEEELRRLGCGGILAMGRGSHESPLLIELDYGDAGRPVDLCLVGKGVTFDSGGLSLKDPDSMLGSKGDMAAAAAVVASMSLLQWLAPSLRVKGILPVVENMPGGHATRPGDIVTGRGGHTIEILNTDFEGRVILSDALTLAGEASPRAIVDLATLTASAVHAFGDRIAALFSNDEAFGRQVAEASARSGERTWPMPMPDHLMPQLISSAADIKNFPGVPSTRAMTAAMFLREFVPPGTSWAHLDIAGPASAHAPYELAQVEGATGFGVRLLAELFVALAE